MGGFWACDAPSLREEQPKVCSFSGTQSLLEGLLFMGVTAFGMIPGM